jgi:oligosaccharide repeat unit polymerase
MKLAQSILPLIIAILNYTSLVSIDANIHLYHNFLILILALSHYLFFRGFQLQGRLGTLFFFLYIQFSLLSSALINKLIKSQIVLDQEYLLAFELGAYLQISLCIISYGFQFLRKNTRVQNSEPQLSSKKRLTLSPMSLNIIFFSFIFSISALSHYLGVSPMGVPAPQLPFKLEPLLNLTRSNLFPFLLVVVWDQFKSHDKSNKILFVLLSLAWLVFEVYAKGSRGFFVIALIPLIIYFILSYNPKPIHLFILALTVLLILPINFILGNYQRGHLTYGSSNMAAFDLSKVEVSPMVSNIYYRLFPEAYLVQKFKDYTPQTSHNWAKYKEHNGGLNFHTYVIDKTPIDNIHSSGMTALADGYLLGGKTGLLFTGLLLILAFISIDVFTTATPCLKTLSLYYLVGLTIYADGFWSYFFFRSPMTFLFVPIGGLVFVYLFGRINIQPITKATA